MDPQEDQNAPKVEVAQLPSVTVQVAPHPQNPTIEQHLDNQILTTTTESNTAETEVSRQVLLVASATLAVLGTLLASDTDASSGRAVKVILVITVLLLAVSIITGVLQFCIEFLFWRNTKKHLVGIRSQVEVENKAESKLAAAKMGISQITNKSSNRICFWMQIVTFLLSVFLLTSVVLIRLA